MAISGGPIYEVTEEEMAWIESVIGIYGGHKEPKPLTCDCVSRAGVPKRSFANKRQAKIWARTSGRPHAIPYQCKAGRWHIHGRKRKKAK